MKIRLHRDKRKFDKGPESDTKTRALWLASKIEEYFQGDKFYYLINEISHM